jgi:hypothetical protein
VLGGWAHQTFPPLGTIAEDGANIYLVYMEGVGVTSCILSEINESDGGNLQAGMVMSPCQATNVLTGNACGVFLGGSSLLQAKLDWARFPAAVYAGSVTRAVTDDQFVHFYANQSIGKLPLP